jgi:hypothetical protein
MLSSCVLALSQPFLQVLPRPLVSQNLVVYSAPWRLTERVTFDLRCIALAAQMGWTRRWWTSPQMYFGWQGLVDLEPHKQQGHFGFWQYHPAPVEIHSCKGCSVKRLLNSNPSVHDKLRNPITVHRACGRKGEHSLEILLTT